MDAQEIAQLCASFSLKDRDGPMMPLREGLRNDGEKRLALRLAGRVKSNKMVNSEVFINIIMRIWRLKHCVDVEVIDGRFICRMIRKVKEVDDGGTGDYAGRYRGLCWEPRSLEDTHKMGGLSRYCSYQSVARVAPQKIRVPMTITDGRDMLVVVRSETVEVEGYSNMEGVD
ncbi:hypothetical protein Ddye_005692 [Dipteronia dyeriana]|uniref:Uncharacterized protein n=1 Tax=Dipteronia dyeriana TaxID=168575 RepID=A0AAD9XGQ5_9ROSI|nr:hypothetical protein Ddye_005692 [Dipteronia dyeriana]